MLTNFWISCFPVLPPRRKFRVGEQESKRSRSWSTNCSPPTTTTTTTLTVLRPDGFAAGKKDICAVKDFVNENEFR